MRLRNSMFLCFLVALLVAGFTVRVAAEERTNLLISKLENGEPVIGVLAGAMAAPRIAKVLGTSDVDFILVDLEHEVYDYAMLRHFILGVNDFSQRYRLEPRPAPSVLVKLGHRAGWDARYEVTAALKAAPAAGVCVPFVESRGDLEKVISAVRHVETSALAGMNIPAKKREPWPLDPEGELLVVAMIESVEGVRNAQEIINTPGLGAIWAVHVSDEAMAGILKMCKEKGVVMLIQATPEDIKAKVDTGYQMICVGWEFQLLQKELGETVQKMRSKLK